MPVPETSAITGNRESGVGIKTLSIADIFSALSRGATDFWRHPSHYLFIALIYPVVGIALAVWSAGGSTFALLYPLATGFALLGPVAALGLYELSRRREVGLDDHPRHAMAVLRHPAIGSMLAVGLYLAAIFALWLTIAAGLYDFYFATNPPDGLFGLLAAATTTVAGWGLIIWGNFIGLCFAILVLATTAIAFPLLVDRGGSAGHAIAVSTRVFLANPIPFLTWGLVVALVLMVASIPLFVGLAVALPILGHATWHLYRKVVA